MPSIGPLELIIILAIVVVLFGATRIGDIGKGMGRGIREFRKELREGQEEDAAKKKTETVTTTTTTVKPSDEKPSQTH
jgi:sec-independent protein translocase protein TatA